MFPTEPVVTHVIARGELGRGVLLRKLVVGSALPTDGGRCRAMCHQVTRFVRAQGENLPSQQRYRWSS